ELVETDLGPAALGAVSGLIHGIPFVSSTLGVLGWRRLGIPPGAGFFSSGVMLIDVERWKEQRIEERAIKLLQESPEEAAITFDQSALNAVVAGNWMPLERRWSTLPRNRWTVELGAQSVS